MRGCSVGARYYIIYLGILILSPILKTYFDLHVEAEAGALVVIVPIGLIAGVCTTTVYGKIEKQMNLLGGLAFVVMSIAIAISYTLVLFERSLRESGKLEPIVWPDLTAMVSWIVWLCAGISFAIQNNSRPRDW